jgi:cathepsin L
MIYKFIVLVALIFFLGSRNVNALSESQYQEEFALFVSKFAKTYTHDETFNRYKIFKANLDKIEEHNAKYKAGEVSYFFGINADSDKTSEEFFNTRLGLKPITEEQLKKFRENSSNTITADSDIPVPNDDSLDWRTKGAVTAVKDQGQCGSCWAFSTTGSTEGAHFVASGNLVSLSEQQLVDCAGSTGNQGCNGGLMDNAFEWITKNGGLCSEDDYPYNAVDGQCQTTCKAQATVSKYTDVDPSDDAIIKALQNGPVSVALEADKSAFQAYAGGVLDSFFCGKQLDHGVLIVGYGTDSDSNKPYWIVKNSWGSSWGEQGYIRIVRGKNMCGIDTMVSQPKV